jgi:CRP-like cAMP-binding protein
MRPLETILIEHPFFHGLNPTFSRLIAGCGKQVRFEQGTHLYRQGDAADSFYIIRHGRVGLELRGAKGAVLFHTEHPGDVINAAWIVPPYRCNSDARALETTVAIALDAACLRSKCESDHDLGYELMKRFVPVLVERLMEARFQALDVYGAGQPG